MPIRQRPQRLRARRRFDHGEPIRWLNLVPLAGVLAITAALILTAYGIRPHAITVQLPAPYPNDDPGPLTPDVDRIVITREGSVLWNGTSVTDRELGLMLAQATRRNPQAGLLFTPEERAPYPRVLQILGMIRQHGLLDRCFRFSGIARFKHYDRPETFDDPIMAQREDCLPDSQFE